MGKRLEIKADVLIIGGGSAGCMAAIRAKELNPDLDVVIFEKGDLKRGGSIAMGMDALNIVAVPGVDTPETYVDAASIAADGILDQKPSHVMARRSYELMKKLESWGVRFTKDEKGQYIMLKIHPRGKFYAAMDEPDLKVILAGRVKKAGVRVLNRIMATSLLTEGGRVVGATGLNIRTGDFVACLAKSVILSSGGQARFTLPKSGYLYGTFDYPGNAGDGYAMAFRAGAQLTGFEYTLCTPLIKDISCPLLYITLTRGARVINARGELVGEEGNVSANVMMKEFLADRGPVFVKMDHLPEEKISEIEAILFSTERPMQKRFFEQRGIDFRRAPIELHPTEFQLCGGHGLTGLVVDERAATTLEGLYAAGDVACVPRQHLTGAFVFGEVAAENAAARASIPWPDLPGEQVRAEEQRVFGPMQGGPSPIDLREMEYKVRRIAGDYVVPPKNGYKLGQGIKWMQKFREELKDLKAADYHQLSKIQEIGFIIDCIELSAVASDARKESRWGFYHYRTDYPEKNDREWLKHIILQKDESGGISVSFKPLERSVL
ncbi:MAG: fumarate reductase/succinate dehydrogenase flavoprotein subunit [Bacillota bacterium]